MKERHPIYSFDAGKDDNTLEALYGVLRLGKNLISVKESDSIYFLMCLTFVDFFHFDQILKILGEHSMHMKLYFILFVGVFDFR